MLLVMFSAGVFTRDNNEMGPELWDLTWAVVDPFCPRLKSDLFPAQDRISKGLPASPVFPRPPRSHTPPPLPLQASSSGPALIDPSTAGSSGHPPVLISSPGLLRPNSDPAAKVAASAPVSVGSSLHAPNGVHTAAPGH